jgi:hypothetical protein
MTFESLDDSEKTAVYFLIKDAVHAAWLRREEIRNKEAREMIPRFFSCYLADKRAKSADGQLGFIARDMVEHIEAERLAIAGRQAERLAEEEKKEKAWLAAELEGGRAAAEGESRRSSMLRMSKLRRLQEKYGE